MIKFDIDNPPKWAFILGWIVLIPFLPFLWLFLVIYFNLVMPWYKRKTGKDAWNPK